MKMRFVPDLPIKDKEQDALGFESFVQLIGNSIYNTEPPFVFGILGDWGTGKTSIMRLLQNQMHDDFVKNKNSFLPIWFDAWRYENETNIIYPLLYAIKADFIQRIGSKETSKEFKKIFCLWLKPVPWR